MVEAAYRIIACRGKECNVRRNCSFDLRADSMVTVLLLAACTPPVDRLIRPHFVARRLFIRSVGYRVPKTEKLIHPVPIFISCWYIEASVQYRIPVEVPWEHQGLLCLVVMGSWAGTHGDGTRGVDAATR